MVAPPDAGTVAQYRALRRELEGLAGHVNGKYAEFDWVPIRYLNRTFSRNTLAGFYRLARIGLVTPLRDGMNLVAKEYVAAQDGNDSPACSAFALCRRRARDGGRPRRQPLRRRGVAEALHRALAMPLEERQKRWQEMMDILRRNNVGKVARGLPARPAGRDAGEGGGVDATLAALLADCSVARRRLHSAADPQIHPRARCAWGSRQFAVRVRSPTSFLLLWQLSFVPPVVFIARSTPSAPQERKPALSLRQEKRHHPADMRRLRAIKTTGGTNDSCQSRRKLVGLLYPNGDWRLPHAHLARG